MARKKASQNGTAKPEPESAPDSPADRTVPLILLPSTSATSDTVKVNNASLTELKHACDDAVSRFLSRPELFKQIHTHTDVRLGLGWGGVFVASATALYGWRVEFEKSKPVVWAGLILYIVLTITQALYAYFIEKNTVFVGRRKIFDKRIETEHITLASRTVSPSSPKPPQYALSLTYVRSSSAGKTLLGRGREHAERGYHEFFDARGEMDQARFEEWVGGLVGRAMESR